MNEKRKAKAHKKAEVAGEGVTVEEQKLLLGLTEKQIVLFLLGFMLVSAVFLGVWYYIGALYQSVVFVVAKYILLAMGYTPAQIAAVRLPDAYLGNFNLVPLVALAIATPGWCLRTRCELLALGVPILFLLHVVDLVAHFPLYFHGSGIAQLVVYSIGVGGVATPFIIWIAFVFFVKRDVSDVPSS